MEILTFILVVVILINNISIKRKLSEMEGGKKVVNSEADVKQNSQPTPGQVFEESVELTDSSIPPVNISDQIPELVSEPMLEDLSTEQSMVREPSVFGKRFAEFIYWMKQDWLAKSGAIILLIGIGWFVSYAFAEGWIGVQGRITIGLVFGALVLLFGYIRMKKSSLQGSLFLVLGSTTILTTVWAAQNMYNMFPLIIALTIMFLSVAFVSVVAVLHHKQSLATVALILGLGAPLLTNSELSFSGLFSYLLVVVVGAIWVVVKTGWKHLLLISLITVFGYSLPFSYDVPREIAGIALLYAFVFSGLFTIVANRTLMRSAVPPSTIDLSIIGGVGLYLFTWIHAAAPAHWESLLYASWAIVFSGIGYMIFRLTKNIKNFLVYAAVGLTYIVLATVATFDGPLLTIALTMEAGFVPVLVYLFTKNSRLLISLSLLLFGPVLLSLSSLMSREWRSDVPFDHFSVLLVLGCVLAGLGFFIYKKGIEILDTEVANWGVGVMSFGILYFFALIWLVPHGFMSPNYDVGTLISLVMYTIIGVTVYVIGHVNDRTKVRFAGGVLAGLVILRLLFVEVWDMQVSTRIITFMMIGVLLIGTAFIEKKNKEE